MCLTAFDFSGDRVRAEPVLDTPVAQPPVCVHQSLFHPLLLLRGSEVPRPAKQEKQQCVCAPVLRDALRVNVAAM